MEELRQLVSRPRRRARRGQARSLACVAGALVLLGVPASASAVVTLGSDVTGSDFLTTPCSSTPAGCAAVQQGLPGRVTVAPFDGVIVRYRARAVGAVEVFVARYTAEDTVLRKATSAPNIAPSVAAIATYPARLPVQAGESIGVLIGIGAEIGYRTVPGADVDLFEPPPSTTTPTTPPSPGQTDAAYEVGINADIEPDVDGDGFGDETQDGCPTDKLSQAPCPARPVDEPPVASTPVLVLGTKRVVTTTRRGVAPIPIACFAAPGRRCRGRVGIEMTIHVPDHRSASQRATDLARQQASRLATEARHKRRRINIRLAAPRRFSVPAGQTRTVQLRLATAARRRLRSCRRVKVRIVITRHDAQGNLKIVKRNATLKSANATRPTGRPAPRYACS